MKTEMQLKALSILRPLILKEFEGTDPIWWENFVLPHISRWNQDRAWRLGPRYFSQLDLAETIRVLMGNWPRIADQYLLDNRYYGVLAHLKHARNRNSHITQHPARVWEQYDNAALAVVEHMVHELDPHFNPEH